MEGAVELISGFIPCVSHVSTEGNKVTITKRFSPGSLAAMIVFGAIGLLIGALL